jgi:hypothetical protein
LIGYLLIGLVEGSWLNDWLVVEWLVLLIGLLDVGLLVG